MDYQILVYNIKFFSNKSPIPVAYLIQVMNSVLVQKIDTNVTPL